MASLTRCRISDIRGTKASTYPARMYIDIEIIADSNTGRSTSSDSASRSKSSLPDGEEARGGVAAVTTRMRPRYLSFRNFYVAWITIKARIPAVEGWVTLVERHSLMRDVHYEMDATDRHTIDLADGDAWVRHRRCQHDHKKEEEDQHVQQEEKGTPLKEELDIERKEEQSESKSPRRRHANGVTALTALRIYMYQPSPRWSNTPYTLTDIQLSDALSVESSGEKERPGGSALSAASTPSRRPVNEGRDSSPLLIPVTELYQNLHT